MPLGDTPYINRAGQVDYKENGFGRYKDLCVNAEEYYRKCISLPIFPKMTEEEVLRVVDIFGRMFKRQ